MLNHTIHSKFRNIPFLNYADSQPIIMECYNVSQCTHHNHGNYHSYCRFHSANNYRITLVARTLWNWKPTLLDSTGENIGIKLCDRAVWSINHLLPDLCHLLQTWRQFLVLWYHWLTHSFLNCSTAFFRLRGSHGYNIRSQVQPCHHITN